MYSIILYLAIIIKGEFGIVYKGYITRNIHSGEIVKDIVAVKTLKGILVRSCRYIFLTYHYKLCPFPYDVRMMESDLQVGVWYMYSGRDTTLARWQRFTYYQCF